MSAQEEFEHIRRQFIDPIQHDYEVIRPIVLFAETAAERSRQTGVERTVVGDKARRFVLEGMLGLTDRRAEAAGRKGHSYPEAIAGYIVYLKQLYPPIHLREIARIVQRKFGFPIVIAKFWSLRIFERLWPNQAPTASPMSFTHNELIRRCLSRRPAERLSLGGRRLSEPFTSCRIKRRLLGHLTTHCRTRCNSLASKIVRLLSGSLLWKITQIDPIMDRRAHAHAGSWAMSQPDTASEGISKRIHAWSCTGCKYFSFKVTK